MKFLEKLKKLIWPINKGEYKKFIPMLLIFFLISFNYNILRAAKDTLIITAPGAGAEVIPFLKVWAILPAAVLMTFIFTKVSNRLSKEGVFYVMITIFLSFFAFFTFFLYPIRDLLTPENFTNRLEEILPLGMKGLISIIRHWPYTIFYVMSELWGTCILTVLFWGFANEISSVGEAKRFYALFGVGANIASIISGQTIVSLSKNIFNSNIPFGENSWDQTVLFLTISVLSVGILIISIFYFLNRTYPKSSKEGKTLPQKKVKQSIRKNLKYLAKSKYLICIALIVICYNITINLVEVVWKNQVKQLYPNASDYNAYTGNVMILMGILATVIALFISGNFLRKFSWTFNALIAPSIALITGIFFFLFFLFKDSLSNLTMLFGSSPLIMSVIFGTLHNCLTRASKYTVFDNTKEIAFIPLDRESKIKGKAAIDGIGSRFGKSGGSIIHQGLLLIFSTLSMSAPYVAIIFLGFLAIWISSVKSLGKQFATLTESPPLEESVEPS